MSDDTLLYDLETNHKAIGRDVSIYSRAADEIERLRAELIKERESRMQAEQAADFLFMALTECQCDGDVQRAYKKAEKRWPWLG